MEKEIQNCPNSHGAMVLRKSKKNMTFRGEDIAFQAIGCTTTVVAGSMITQEARELNMNGVRNLIEATMKLLDRLPAEDAACSEMVALALGAAVDTYEKRIEDPDFPVITYTVSNSCVPKEENQQEEEEV